MKKNKKKKQKKILSRQLFFFFFFFAQHRDNYSMRHLRRKLPINQLKMSNFICPNRYALPYLQKEYTTKA